MPQIIEWSNPMAEDVVWRYPNEEITWGAQLIVHEYEVAVFFRDGKSYDAFGPGRHVLTTLNLPLLTGALSKVAGYDRTPFKSTVIFISTKQFAGKFGTRAQTTELAPLMTYGSFWFKIEDPSIFVNEVVGGQNAYSTSDVNNFLRGFVNEKMIDELSRYDLVTVFTKLDETSAQVKGAIIDYFRRLGVQLVDLKFEGVDTSPEYRERLFWLKSGRITPEEVLRMETVKEAAKELGKSSGGAAFGTGMVLVPPLFQTMGAPTSAPSVALVICPSCNAQIPSTSKFCPSCGKSISPSTPPAQVPVEKCKSCGEVVPVGAKFCSSCGAKLS
jgi:membrane protease subunit (stomatin/prohibitin family)